MIAADYRSTLLAGGAGTLAMWIAAFGWHHLLLSEFYVQNLFPGNGFSQVSVPLLFLGYLLLGLSMAWVAPRPAPDQRVGLAGLRFGFVMGMVAVAPMSVMIFAVREATPVGIALDLSWHLLVEQPLGGFVITWVLVRALPQARPATARR
ncbi:hypothetical protein [Corallococcus silvisoli]|uniref:hypothetical protein n=1 Tax=Corallococcus silvisoli TaxID=2697031 RepID=UPI0013770BCA|nr:hypothetical protein [Corallococcus silvisoli]NBD13076.1 hypothetical protein [Corallococcus silvisoli]